MANIKFFRTVASYWETNTPQEGYIWFNTDDTTINLYKSGNWEAYSGVKSASYINNTLTITPCKGEPITIDLSLLKNAEDLTGLVSRVSTLETNYTSLDGKVTTVDGKVIALEGKMTTVESEVKKLEGITDKVTTYVVGKISEEETARTNADNALSGRIETLETANTTTSTAISDLKTFVGFDGGVNVANQISNAVNALDSSTTGTGSYVDVTVTQTDGKIAGVTVADGDLTTAFNAVNKSISDEVTRATGVEANLQTAINTEKGRVDTLVGSDANKSVRTIANEELAAQLLNENGAVDNFTTLKELATWLEKHPEDAATMNQSINTNTTNIATNTADITTIKGQITTINTTIEENEQVTAAAITDLDTRIKNLGAGTVSSVTGSGYISTTTTDGAVTVSAKTGAVATGGDTLVIASDVKSYVGSIMSWGEF